MCSPLLPEHAARIDAIPAIPSGCSTKDMARRVEPHTHRRPREPPCRGDGALFCLSPGPSVFADSAVLPAVAESAMGVQAAQQQRAAAALAQRLQAACVTIAEHEMAAADFKRYFQEQQDRIAMLGEASEKRVPHSSRVL